MQPKAPRILPGAERLDFGAGAFVDFVPAFFGAPLAAELLESLPAELALASHRVRVFGRWHDEPRQSAWHADPGCAYVYSGLRHEPEPFGPKLRGLRETLESALEVPLNSVLANLYRDGQDAMGWHSDDEAVFGPDPIIASLSFGAARRFLLRRKDKSERREFLLQSGDLLVMFGTTQALWQHSLPRTQKVKGPRLNLTFRHFIVPLVE